ncbi:MAG: hypothetical protein MK078_04185 [Crocinitomicaceae bacterium]|nr:hypothetical protein [Crocinitomicaceae bacterium]
MRLLIFILLCIGSVSYGQFSNVVIGDSNDPSRVRNFSGFIGTTKTALFTLDYIYLNRKKQELLVSKYYKTDLKEMQTTDIFSNPYEDYWSDPQELYFQNGEFQLFSILKDVRDNYHLLRLQRFNEHLESISDEVIDTIRPEEKAKFIEEESGDGFIVSYYDKLAKIKDRYVRVLALNPDGTERFREKVKSPVALQNFVVEDLIYKKNQPLYILCNYSLISNASLTNSQDRLINNKYTLWAYDRDHKFLKEFEMRFNIKWAHGVKMELNQSDELVISGFVNETRNRSVNGVFTMIVNKNFEVINSSTEALEMDVVNQFLSEREIDKVKEIDGLYLREMIMMEDDSYYLLGEEYDKYTERNYDPRTNITTTIDHFYFYSILAVHFTPEGKVNWAKRIGKMQNSTNDEGYFSSFATFANRNELYIYFNDHKDNVNLPSDAKDIEDLNENRRSVIAGLQITADSISARKLIGPSNYDFYLRASMSNQISDEYIYLQTEGKRSGRILAIPLEED